MSVVIFSGEIHSGKTTALLNWVINREDIAGILMPGENGRRMFYDIAEKTSFPAQVDADHKNAINVGAFVFDAAAFAKANRVLEKAVSGGDSLIIIDEVGKLELKDLGFGKILETLIKKDRDLLLVVRKELLGDIIQKFGLQNARIISSIIEYQY
jgi:nucleoside-triphosphatase THEP1